MLRSDELVIFDCDGVLVDSEPLTMKVLAESVHGLDAATAYRRFRGRKIADCLRELESEFDQQFTPDFIAEFRDACLDIYRNELTCDPALRGVVEGLGNRYCVGTSAPVEKVEAMLRAVGVWDLFQSRIFSAYVLKMWKPSPELFLTAARIWDVTPSHCLVVEDSPTGVVAACNAGMHTIVLDPRGEAVEVEFAGTERIRSIAELPECIAAWQRRRRDTQTTQPSGEFITT